MDSQGDKPNFVESTLKSVDVLQELHRSEQRTVTEIAAKLPYSKSTVHRHLQTLKEAEYVIEDEEGFRISMLYLDYGIAARDALPIHRVAAPKLREVAEQTGEKVFCVIEEHGLAVFLDRVEGKHSVKTYARIGERSHLHYYAGGKAILAFLDRDRIEEIIEQRGLPKQTAETTTSKETLFDELEQIREQGAAFNMGESITGVNGVGVPILRSDQTPYGSISLAGPANRLDRATLESDVVPLLQRVVNEMEVELTVEARDEQL